MLLMENDINLQYTRLCDVSHDRSDNNRMIDIRGHFGKHVVTQNNVPFTKFLGHSLNIQNFINAECGFRLVRKCALSSLKLKVYLPENRVVFNFACSDKECRPMMTNAVKNVIIEMITRHYLGMHVNNYVKDCLEQSFNNLTRSKTKELNETIIGLESKCASLQKIILNNPASNDGHIKNASTLELLEEIESRYKSANVDWANDLIKNKNKRHVSKERVIKLFGT